MSEEIFKPKGVIALDSPDYISQIRLGLQGGGGTGKTYVSTRFPNPIFLSWDNGLIAHVGKSNILEVPFYSKTFANNAAGQPNLQYAERKEALLKWLESDGQKLSKKQTLILDNNDAIQAEYHAWWERNKESYLTYDGKIDGWKEWRLKIAYYSELMLSIKSLKCHVIWIFHESPDRDKQGNLMDLSRPLLTGQFQDELMGHFTDFFRTHAYKKPDPKDAEQWDKAKKFFGVDDKTLGEWNNSTDREHQTFYVWQTQVDKWCKCKTSLVNAPKYLIAHPDSLTKYGRKLEDATV